MDFKELDKEVKEVFQRYNKENFLHQMLAEQKEESDFCKLVDFCLSNIDEDLEQIIKKEYIERSAKHWWQLYYSRTTYYRIKRKAMEEFLACLKR